MKKDIVRVLITNILKVFVAVFTSFVVPNILSVDSFGYLKLYQFYVSYVGITHLGYCDGVYLKYGGYKLDDIDKKDFLVINNTLLIYESFISIFFCLLGVFLKNFNIFFVGVIALPQIMATLYIYIFQATGEFKSYSTIINSTTCINLICNIVLVLMKVADYRVYVILDCLVQLIYAAIGFWRLRKLHCFRFTKPSIKIWINMVRGGILLLLGNVVYTLFLGIDKWFINYSLEIEDFSRYSFAGQMVTVVNMFITPVAMTLYSNLSKRKDHAFEIKLKRIILCILMFIPLLIYAIEFVIINYVEKYADSLNVVALLLICQIFLCMNISIFVNLYKVYKKQKQYFIRLLIALSVAFVLNMIVLFINPNIYLFAISTLISCVVWLALNMNYFKYLSFSVKELAYIISLLLIYVLLFRVNLWIRVLVYLISYLAFTRFLMKDTWDYFEGEIVNILTKTKKLIKK